jgi:DNA-binding CsgD family transcriptional regulator
MNQGLKQAAVANDSDLNRLELIGLTLVANGVQSAEAAVRLAVSEREIETLLFCAQQKLGAKNRVHAVAIAIRQGLIGIEV